MVSSSVLLHVLLLCMIITSTTATPSSSAARVVMKLSMPQISKVCSAAASPKFCTRFLHSALGVAEAATLKGAGEIVLKLAEVNATATFGSLLYNGTTDPKLKTVLMDCIKLYGRAMSSIKAAHCPFVVGRYSDALSLVSDAVDASTQCSDMFHKAVLPPPADRGIRGFPLICGVVSAIAHKLIISGN